MKIMLKQKTSTPRENLNRKKKECERAGLKDLSWNAHLSWLRRQSLHDCLREGKHILYGLIHSSMQPWRCQSWRDKDSSF